MPHPRRTLTGISQKSERMSLRRRLTPSLRQQGKDESSLRPHEARFAVYNGLSWGTIKGFLETRFPDCSFNEQKVGDYWVFDIPEALSEADKKEIEKLRDQNPMPRQRSVSPE